MLRLVACALLLSCWCGCVSTKTTPSMKDTHGPAAADQSSDTSGVDLSKEDKDVVSSEGDTDIEKSTDQSSKTTGVDISHTNKTIVTSSGPTSVSENDKWTLRLAVAGLVIMSIPHVFRRSLYHWHEHCERNHLRTALKTRADKMR